MCGSIEMMGLCSNFPPPYVVIGMPANWSYCFFEHIELILVFALRKKILSLEMQRECTKSI